VLAVIALASIAVLAKRARATAAATVSADRAREVVTDQP
jgi:hypothetical protein